MKPKNDRTQSGESRPVLPPAPARFRIKKLEERIAPKGWGKGGKSASDAYTVFKCTGGCI